MLEPGHTCRLFLLRNSQSIEYLPMRARKNPAPQEAARTFTRTCTHLVARNSCCRMAFNCPSGGECPPANTKPFAHNIREMMRFAMENHIFCNG